MNTIFPKYGVFNFTIYYIQKKNNMDSNRSDEPAHGGTFFQSQTSILQLRQTGQWIHSRSTMGTPGGEKIPGLEKKKSFGL